jgi:hypothetical protein
LEDETKHHKPAEPLPVGSSIDRPVAQAVSMQAVQAVVSPTGPIKTNASLHSITAQGWDASGASNGDVAFVTGNTWAGLTSDGGTTFTGINPTTVFPQSLGGLCCDQIVHFSDQHNRFFWLLQYNNTGSSDQNLYRLAYAPTNDLVSHKGAAWTYIDLTAAALGLLGYMDYPDLALGAGALYITAQIIGAGLLIVRIPLDQLDPLGAGNIVHFQYLYWTKNSWVWRVTQYAGSRAYWAVHNSMSQMRVFWSDEGSDLISYRDLDIFSWTGGGFASTTPDGVNWLARLNNYPTGGVLGAAVVGADVWFVWSAAADPPGTKNGVPRAHLNYVQLHDTGSDVTLVAKEVVYDPGHDLAYPALAANRRGVIGLTLEWGGGGSYENHAVGTLVPFQATNVTASTKGTDSFGDYVTIRRQYPEDDALWSAYGWAYKEDPTTTPPFDYADPDYVVFAASTSNV